MIKALILAGGKGNELLPLTQHTPKPLLPIGNIPLLLFQIAQLKKAGITEIILSISYPPRKIKAILDDGSRFGILLRYNVETTPMGTAGAFKLIENLVEGPTVIINGDVLSDFPLSELMAAHRKTKAMVTIGTSRVLNPQAYGVVETNARGRVIGFAERPRRKQVKGKRINAGFYLVEPEVLRWIPTAEPFFFENDLFPSILETGARFQALDIGQNWREITRPAGYLQSNMDFLDGRLTSPAFTAFPNRHEPPENPMIEIDDQTRIDGGCTIKPTTRIVHSVIGSGCRIEEGVFIRNSVLWPGCVIQRGAVISGTILGRGCQIGEGSYLRAGNIMGDKSVITSHSRA